jgi:hypothetical protein
MGSCTNKVEQAFYSVSQKLSDCRELELPINIIKKQADKIETIVYPDDPTTPN